ncbi:hypothetical protein B5181_37995, partial [Streptomyces sp. 4F]
MRGVSHNPSRVRGGGNRSARVCVHDHMGAKHVSTGSSTGGSASGPGGGAGGPKDGDRRIGRRALLVGGTA